MAMEQKLLIRVVIPVKAREMYSLLAEKDTEESLQENVKLEPVNIITMKQTLLKGMVKWKLKSS